LKAVFHHSVSESDMACGINLPLGGQEEPAGSHAISLGFQGIGQSFHIIGKKFHILIQEENRLGIRSGNALIRRPGKSFILWISYQNPFWKKGKKNLGGAVRGAVINKNHGMKPEGLLPKGS